MAAKRRRGDHVDYHQLHNLSSVVLYDERSRRQRRKTFTQTFTVQRIIFRRKSRNDSEYLIKWQGWPLEHCTWEPAEHLTPQLLRSYDKPPKPGDARMEEAGRQFYMCVVSTLKSKSLAPAYIHMDLDLWRYVTYNRGVASEHKGYTLYTRDDLCLLQPYLPHNWWYVLDSHGQGQAVKDPLKVKPVLSWTPSTQAYQNCKFLQANRMPLEKLCVDILKRPCDANNLFE